jgi:PAS domain S-box-containing protein
LDTRRNELRWSAETYRIFGIPIGTPLTYEAFLAAIHPDDREYVDRKWSAALRGEPYDLEHRIVVDGAVKWVREQAELEVDEGGALLGGFGSVQDITQRKRAEENTQWLASFPLLNPNPIVELTPDGVVTYVNPTARRLFPGIAQQGVDHPLLAGWDVLTAKAADDLGEPVMREIAVDGRTYALRLHYVQGSGRRRVYGMDITDRTRAEEALRQNREDLDRAQEVGQIGSWRLDVRRNVLTWSDENHRIFGVPKGTPLTYESFLATIHPDDRQYVDTKWQAGLRGEPYDIEHRLVADGRVKWVREKAYLEFDHAGGLLGGFGITQDITARRHTEEALRESEARFRSLAEALPTIVWTARPDGAIEWYNRQWYDYTGEAPGAGEGWSWDDLVHPEDLPPTLAIWKQALQDRVIAQTNLRLRRHDGQYRWFLVRAWPQADASGNVVQWFGTSTDIDEIRLAEQALRDSEARQRLLADTSARLLASDEPQSLVNELCWQVMEHLDCQVFFNFLVNEPTGRLQLNAYAGIPVDEAQKIEWLDIGTAVCGCVARDGEPLVACDIPNTPDPRTELVKSYGVRAYACHPLWGQGQVIGTLSFGTKTRDRFADADLALMQVVTDQVALAMQRIRAADELRRLNVTLEARVQERTAELVRAHESVRIERQRLSDVFELLPAYVCLLSPDYHMPFANRFFRERFGESHGRRCFEFLFNRTEPCDVCDTYQVLTDNRPRRWEWTGPDGRNYDIYDFPFTENDGTTHILEMGLDITERKQAERELRGAALYARNLIETSLDPLVTISTDGTITDVNAATEQITGLPRERLIGSDFSNYFTEPDRAREGYRLALSAGAVRDYPLTIRHVGGNTADVLYHAAVVRDETGHVRGVFAAARDVTERKRAEQQAFHMEKMVALGQMVASVAHEINNPNNFITFNLPLIQEYLAAVEPLVEQHATANPAFRPLGFPFEEFRNRLHQTLSGLENATRRLRSITGMLRDYVHHRLGSNRREATSPAAVIAKAMELVGKHVGKTVQHIEVRVDDDLPLVAMDSARMEQVLINLLLNSAQAVSGPDSRVTVTARRAPDQDGWVQLIVTDNGVGIPPEIHGRLFEPFFTTKGPEMGTGLGLPIAQSIVLDHNGRIWAEENHAPGARFVIELPVCSDSSPPRGQ